MHRRLLALPLLLSLTGAAAAQELYTADLSGAWRIKIHGTFDDPGPLQAKFKGKSIFHLQQVVDVLTGLSQEKFGDCGLVDEPLTGEKELFHFTLQQVAPVLDLQCAEIGSLTLDFTGTLLDGAHAAQVGAGTVDSTIVQTGLTLTGTMKRISGMQTPDDPDGDGPAVPLALMGSGEPGSEGVHDLAITRLVAPKKVINPFDAPPVKRTVRVQIQNRSQHDEVIEDAVQLAALVTLENDAGGDTFPAIEVALDAPGAGAFPITLAPRKRLWLRFDVAFEGWIAAGDGSGPCISDTVAWTARVDHAVLDGEPDDHPADDVAPRSVVAPYTFDAYPDGKVRERGVGAKKADGSLGDPVTTWVVGCIGRL